MIYLLIIFLLDFTDPIVVGRACRAKLADIQKEAEGYLEVVSKKEGVKEIYPGKLYFKILRDGTGLLHANPSDLVTIKYTAYVMEGEEDPQIPREETRKMHLKYCFPGLRDGITGMAEGEIRRIYIHPELTQGKYGPLAPYGLNFYDIELVTIEPHGSIHEKRLKGVHFLHGFRD